MNTYEMTKEEQDKIVFERSLKRGTYAHLTEEINRQYATYKQDLSKEEWRARHRGVYVKFPKEQMKKGAVRRVFEAFLKNERVDYFKSHDFSVEDIVNIGIDKFVVANGWLQPRDASAWRNNKVRIGPCPHCKDQFVTKIYEANHGLCLNCVPLFSNKAIQGFMTKEAHSTRYHDDHAGLAIDFYMIFSNEDSFRNLFLKDTESAAEYEGELDAYEQKLEEEAKLRSESEPCDEKKDDSNVINISEDGEVID